MQLTSLITILATAGLATAGCYSGGEKWGDSRNAAIDFAGRWCNSEGGAGDYRAGQTKFHCSNLPSGGNRVDFYLQNKGNDHAKLSTSDCNKYLKEMINCNHGGAQDKGGWYMRYVFHCSLSLFLFEGCGYVVLFGE